MRRVKKKPPKEFSKKILIVAGIINAVVIVFTMVMIWRTLDLSPLAYPPKLPRVRDSIIQKQRSRTE